MEFDHGHKGDEFDWVAVDVHGFTAYLSTAGYGPLPLSVLRNTALFEGLLERAMALNETCDAIPNKRVTGNIDDWVRLARRGLFAYDWSHELECYQIIAIPRVPRPLEAFGDAEFVNLARVTALPLGFRETDRIEPAVVP